MLGRRSKQHISKSFVQSSWKDMSALLDKEMPAPVHGNYTAIGILSTLLFFSMIAIAFLWFKLDQQIPFTTSVKEKIVYKHIYLNNADIIPSDQGIKRVSIPQNELRGNPTIVSGRNAQTNQLSDLSLNNVPVVHAESNQNKSPLTYLSSISAKEVFVSADAGNSSLERLDNERASAPIPLVDLNEDNQARIGVSLGILSFLSHDSDYTGYGVISGIEYKLSKKLSLNSGLGLNFVSRDFNFFPFFEKDVSNELYKSVSEYDLRKQETYYSGLRGFKQLLVPLSINYHVNNTLSISGGLKFRYTYSEKIDKELAKSARKKIPVTEEPGNVFFNNSNIGLTAGIRYNLSKNVSLSLDSEWGLSSLINRNSFVFPSTRTKYDLNLVNFSTSFTF